MFRFYYYNNTDEKRKITEHTVIIKKKTMLKESENYERVGVYRVGSNDNERHIATILLR